MSERCCKTVYGYGNPFYGSQCGKRGKVYVNGKWFCTIHSPEYRSKKDAEIRARWAEDDRKRREEQARKQQEIELIQACHARGIMTAEQLNAALGTCEARP